MQSAEAFDQLIQIALTSGLPTTTNFLLWFGLEAASLALSVAVDVMFFVPIYLCILGAWTFLKALVQACNEQRP